jgi:hypothetical protein
MMRRQGIVFGGVTLLRACGGLGSMSLMRGMGYKAGALLYNMLHR